MIIPPFFSPKHLILSAIFRSRVPRLPTLCTSKPDAPNPRTALLNALRSHIHGVPYMTIGRMRMHTEYTVQYYTVVPSIVIQGWRRPPLRSPLWPVSNNHAVRPRARMPSTARRVDSIRPRTLTASALAYCACLSDNYPRRMEGVPGCLAWTPPLLMRVRARAVSSKQDNQAAAWMVGDPFILPADCDPTRCRPTRARLANGWIPGHRTAPV